MLGTKGHFRVSEPQACPYGRIILADESGPANFSFQKAKGKLGSVQEAIRDSAELGLSGAGAGVVVSGCVFSDIASAPTGTDPLGQAVLAAAVAGTVGSVTAVGAALAGPVVGAKGLILSLKTVTPAELQQREEALNRASQQVVAQQSFHDALLEVAREKVLGGFVSNENWNSPEEPNRRGGDAILDARVEDLRLERAGSGEGSYVLRIRTRARLLRASDHAVLLEQQAEYRSGKALFLDWTLEGALEGVARTGYVELARYYVDQLFHVPTVTAAR